MADFKFHTDIPVRIADLDAFGHVNNAKYLSYIESARFYYMDALGLWQGDVVDSSVIIADIHIAYLAPAFFRSTVRVGTRVAHLGGKSMRFEHDLRDAASGDLLATAETIIVAYDYQGHKTMPVPVEWRQKITAFEGIPPNDG